MAWVKWAFMASLLVWAAGGIWIMSSDGTITFDMTSARAIVIHALFGGLTLVLGIILLIHWMRIRLYS
jgi:hypothetical protein